MLYMSSSFWLLGVESPDFFQAEEERTACKAEQIHKRTTIFTRNDNLTLDLFALIPFKLQHSQLVSL
jgi:hypothetical protein